MSGLRFVGVAVGAVVRPDVEVVVPVGAGERLRLAAVSAGVDLDRADSAPEGVAAVRPGVVQVVAWLCAVDADADGYVSGPVAGVVLTGVGDSPGAGPTGAPLITTPQQNTKNNSTSGDSVRRTGEGDEGLPLSTLPAVTWDPTEQKTEEKLIALAYLWGRRLES